MGKIRNSPVDFTSSTPSSLGLRLGTTYKNLNFRRSLISSQRMSQAAQMDGGSDLSPQPDLGSLTAESPISLNEGTSGGGANNGGTAFETLDPNVVIILVVLLFALICAAFLNSIMRCVMRRSSRVETPEEPHSAEGLDVKALATLPILAFRSAEKVKEGSVECTICLSEFTESEKVRLLPKCNHVFHIDCIDMWLLSHVTCPVCRDSVVDDPKLQLVVVDDPSQENSDTMGSQSNMRAELLRERIIGSDAIVLSTASPDVAGRPRGRGSAVRASLYSMFAAENVVNLFTAHLGASRGHAVLSSGSAASTSQRR